jgi:hypothetical protein
MKDQKRGLLAALFVLILPLTMACSMSRVLGEMMGAETPATVVVVPNGEATQAPAATEAPTSAPEPTATPEPTVNPGVCTHVDHFDICVPSELATALVVSTVPEVNDQMGAPWEIAPEHVEITLNGYPLSGTQLSNKIYIYPIDKYTTLQPDNFPGVISNLKEFVDTGTPSKLPYVPFVNAGPLLRSKVVVYQNDQIQGGSELTQFAQSFYPINNQMLFFTFQGMTKDGKYYINVTMPITQQDLVATGDDIPGGDFEAFANTFTQYIDQVRPQLDAAASDTFTPHYDLMTQIVQGITYTP